MKVIQFLFIMLVSCSYTLEECQEYSGSSLQYCWYTHAPKLESIEQCTAAGDWMQDCRHFWIENKLWTTEMPRNELLQDCGQNNDCTLDVLDARHSSSIYEQLILCEQWTGNNQRHCASHAMQRWRYTERSADDFNRLLALQNPFAEEIGYWLALTQHCDHLGQCQGSGDAYQICTGYTVKLRQGLLTCQSPSMHPTKPTYYQ